MEDLRLKKNIRRAKQKQFLHQPERLEMYRAFMTGYVKRINEATFNVPIGGIRIGSAKYSRLAQINLESRIITFSCYAIENVPERGRRYLVLHELAHVKETNHTKRFWQLVEKYEPDYRQIGKSLEAAFKKNVKEDEKNTNTQWSHINQLSLISSQAKKESIIESGLDFEEIIGEVIMQEEEFKSPLLDCEIDNFLDWTIE